VKRRRLRSAGGVCLGAATACRFWAGKPAAMSLPAGNNGQQRVAAQKKAEKALLCADKGVRPSGNECGGKPILPEPRSVNKANSYQ